MTRDNHGIFKILMAECYPVDKTITFLLSCEGHTKAKIAAMSGVDNAMVTRTIAGRRGSKKVERIIVMLLGFDPFLNYQDS